MCTSKMIKDSLSHFILSGTDGSGFYAMTCRLLNDAPDVMHSFFFCSLNEKKMKNKSFSGVVIWSGGSLCLHENDECGPKLSLLKKKK